MQLNRRRFLAGTVGTSAMGLVAGACVGQPEVKKAGSPGPGLEDLERAAAAPVLKQAELRAPVIIESIRLLKRDNEYFVHIRSKEGAEGVSVTNPPRAEYLDKILKQLVIPFFIGILTSVPAW